MQRAVLYARVSSDQQKKEHTIDSQILELKKQIAAAGDVLVREYVDDGYSGARLDRPGLDQLRKDLKATLFDTIYFLNADRIARDVTYQTIIIGELLKYKKQIVINGKDYVHNPENKFTLTVLGAVAELERAKITERAQRGRQMRLSQGHLLGLGVNTFGYDYRHKTQSSPAALLINEKEASVVRWMFREFGKGRTAVRQIARTLEERGHLTKKGKTLWTVSRVKSILRNPTYTGVKYFNRYRKVRTYSDALTGTKMPSCKIVRRDKADWIGIKVPAIIDQALFDKAQQRFAWNRQHYRNPPNPQLLSSLIRCGRCRGAMHGVRSYYVRDRQTLPSYVQHRISYACSRRFRDILHRNKPEEERCHNKQIKSALLEEKVFAMIKETLLDPQRLGSHMEFIQEDARAKNIELAGQLKDVNGRIHQLEQEKGRVIDLYVSGDLLRDAYVTKSLAFDNKLNELKGAKEGIAKRMLSLHNEAVMDVAIVRY